MGDFVRVIVTFRRFIRMILMFYGFYFPGNETQQRQ